MTWRRLSGISIALFVLLLGAECEGGSTEGGGSGGGGGPIARVPEGGQPLSVVPLSIEEPSSDTIATSEAVDASGLAPVGSSVNVDAGAAATAAQISGTRWSADGVALSSSPLNVVTAKSGGREAQVLVTKASGLTARSPQKFRFDWTPAADAQLARIGDDTLDATLTPAQRSAFVRAVKARMDAILITRYDGSSVQLVQAPGADVHTIEMRGDSGGIFGQSPYDCGNTHLQERSEVWVGTYRRSMSNVANWSPMARTDSLAVRIEDVAQALARTSAHELGHSVGLVGDGRHGCGFMLGCDGGHNCEQVDEQQALADRFDRGRYIMDPGQKTTNHARLAEPTVQRAVMRSPASFNNFNDAYLSIVHPAP